MKYSTTNFVQDFFDEVRSRMGDRRSAALDDAWRTGYEAAAEVFLGLLARNIDELQSRLGGLSKDDQVALSRLHELQRAAKKELADPWSTPIGLGHEDPPRGRAS